MIVPAVHARNVVPEHQDVDSLRAALDEQVARALVAVSCRHDVATISVRPDGKTLSRCITTPPTDGDPTLTALGQIMVLLAGRVLYPGPGQDDDVKRADEIASKLCATPDEARAFVEFARARVVAAAERPAFQRAHAELRRGVAEDRGELNLGYRSPRDGNTQPPSLPAIIVNVPPQPAPIVNITVPPQPDKRVLFAHDADGHIVEAITETAA
jgi:hypothetical protein